MMQYIKYNTPDGCKFTQDIDGVHVRKGSMEAVITRNGDGYNVQYVNRGDFWTNGFVTVEGDQRFRSLMFNLFG